MNALRPIPPAGSPTRRPMQPASEGLLNVHQLIAIFRRRLKIFCALVLLCCAAAALYTLRQTPDYQAVATVMLNLRAEQVTDVKEVTGKLENSNASVQTEVEILRSRQLADRVITALKLDSDPEFNPSLAPPDRGVLSTVAGWFGGAPPAVKVVRTPAELALDRSQVLDAVMANLDVQRVPDTYVINVAFRSISAQKSARIANAFADRYLLGQLESKTGATREATGFLSSRLEQLRGEVQTAEAAVEQYRAQNNLLSTSGASLTEQEISAYNQSVASAKADLAEKEARLRTARAQMRAGSNGEDVGAALNSSVVQSLRAQRAQISSRVAEMSTRYGARHPEMLKAQKQLTDIDGQIQAEVGRIISNLEAEVEVARGRTNTVQGSLYGARGTLAATNKASVRLRELERNAEAVRAVYESFLNRYRETSSQEGLERTDGRVVSQAKVPSYQHSPNVTLNLALGFVVGLGAGLAGIVLMEAMSSGFASGTEIEQKLGLPHLASIPALASVAKTREPPAQYVVSKPLSGFAEAFRSLRTSVLHARDGHPPKIVLITSALPGEGKTTTSLCLARTAALQGQSVVVVDCDLRRKGVSAFVRGGIEHGLLEVLEGKASLDDALIVDPETECAILGVSNRSLSPRDVFDTAEMRNLLAQLSNRYELIILDTPPVLAVADTRILAGMADVVVIAARWRKTAHSIVNSAVDLIESAGGFIGGVALTRIDMKQQRLYGYGDPTYYYQDYAKYYAS